MASAFRYRFLSVVGEGGFGRVYRARLETDDGFQKDVAIKVLSDPNPQKPLLQRFRDEARILGLLRDRAIVSAEPPVQIGGRWAVVMEYVDGCSLGTILYGGPIPAGVALEIIGELARALDHAFHMDGPDGQPLHLLHRDVKPENIQLTPSGEIRLLDFGIARAEFARREYHTVKAFGGTPGFIAPERVHGVELPAGDVYSLGVVLHEMVTVMRPTTPLTVSVDKEHHQITTANEADLAALRSELGEGPTMQAVMLAAWMRSEDPARRPSAREVEDWCRRLRHPMPGPFFREWAETHVPHRTEIDADEMVGQVLTGIDVPRQAAQNTFDPASFVPEPGSMTGETRTVALGAVLGTGLTLVFVLGALGVGVGGFLAYSSGMFGAREEAAAASAEPTLSGVLPSGQPVVPQPPAPAPASTAPSGATPAPAPIGGRPGPKVVVIGDPGVRAPEPVLSAAPKMEGLPPPTPKPTRPTGTLRVRTVPSGATIQLDGKTVYSSDNTFELGYGEPHFLVLVGPNGETTARAPIPVSVGKVFDYCWDFTKNLRCEE